MEQRHTADPDDSRSIRHLGLKLDPVIPLIREQAKMTGQDGLTSLRKRTPKVTHSHGGWIRLLLKRYTLTYIPGRQDFDIRFQVETYLRAVVICQKSEFISCRHWLTVCVHA